MINAINIALSGLTAASKKIAASASNIANVQTTGSLEDENNAPYTPIRTEQKATTGESGNPQGVHTTYTPKTQPFSPVYDPDSPYANKEGFIGAPNVDLAEEAINISLAELAYKANIETIRTAEEMSAELMRIVDEEA